MAFANEMLRQSTAHTLALSGFQSFHASALDTLADVHIRYLVLLADTSRAACEMAGRTRVSVSDVFSSLRLLDIHTQDLHMYLNAGWTKPLVELPPTLCFPVDVNGDVSYDGHFTPIVIDPHLIIHHLAEVNTKDMPLLVEPDIEEREIDYTQTSLVSNTNMMDNLSAIAVTSPVLSSMDISSTPLFTLSTDNDTTLQLLPILVDQKQPSEVELPPSDTVSINKHLTHRPDIAVKWRNIKKPRSHLTKKLLEQKFRRAKFAATVAADKPVISPEVSDVRPRDNKKASKYGKHEIESQQEEEPPTTLTMLKLLHRKPTLLATITSDSLFSSPSASLGELNSVLPSVTLGMTSEERQKKKDQTYCVCENPTVDFGQFMLSCDACKVWYHGSCVEVYEGMVKENDRWYCPRCRQKGIVPRK